MIQVIPLGLSTKINQHLRYEHRRKILFNKMDVG